MLLDPSGLFRHSKQAERAGSHTPDLLRRDKTCLFQDADVLFHARKGHAEFIGKIRNRRIASPELFQNTASGCIRQRAKRSIKAIITKLNHIVQCMVHSSAMRNPYSPDIDRMPAVAASAKESCLSGLHNKSAKADRQ
ncbi:MAG: hypothetical protein ABL931_07420 [Usitatibacteraceae bacterium]